MLELVWFFDRVRTVIKKKTELKQRRARMGQKKKYLDAESCRKVETIEVSEWLS